MRSSLRYALKVYKYLSLLFSLAYWVYIVIDDYIFIQKYWESNWLEYLILWVVYFLIYFIAFSFYFWTATVVVALIYVKVIVPVKEKMKPIE